jgi:hypothetical protein
MADLNNHERKMFKTFDQQTGRTALWNGSSPLTDSASDPTSRFKHENEHFPKFSKIFRWQPRDPDAPGPASVELVGTLTDWRAVALTRDAVTNTWQLALHGISGNRTHRNMFLVNGEPAHDQHCDGLAVPDGFEEQQFQLMTARGPRIFLMFAQTK